MRLKPTAYLIHRWLGLIIGLQLLAWSLGGLIFSISPINEVRGRTDAVTSEPIPLDMANVTATPAFAIAAAREAVDQAELEVVEVRLKSRRGRQVYDLLNSAGHPVAVVDGATGEVLPPLDAAGAGELALADFAPEAKVLSATLIEGELPMEARGRPSPIFQVILDHPKEPHLYLSPITGEVLARRNEMWRRFDFFWMLHVMDYEDRDDFNHLLLQGASLLAVLTSLSGIGLWWWRAPWRRRRNRRSSSPRDGASLQGADAP